MARVDAVSQRQENLSTMENDVEQSLSRKTGARQAHRQCLQRNDEIGSSYGVGKRDGCGARKPIKLHRPEEQHC